KRGRRGGHLAQASLRWPTGVRSTWLVLWSFSQPRSFFPARPSSQARQRGPARGEERPAERDEEPRPELGDDHLVGLQAVVGGAELHREPDRERGDTDPEEGERASQPTRGAKPQPGASQEADAAAAGD